MTEPDYTQLLSRTIQLDSGRVQRRTLAGAASFIANLPNHTRSRQVWEYAASSIERAAVSRRGADIVAATMQIERALVAEGWVR